jgi:hypothetical protein
MHYLTVIIMCGDDVLGSYLFCGKKEEDVQKKTKEFFAAQIREQDYHADQDDTDRAFCWGCYKVSRYEPIYIIVTSPNVEKIRSLKD